MITTADVAVALALALGAGVGCGGSPSHAAHPVASAHASSAASAPSPSPPPATPPPATQSTTEPSTAADPIDPVLARTPELAELDLERRDEVLARAFRDAATARALLAAPLVELGIRASSEIRYVGPDGGRVDAPATCRAWLDLKRSGGYPEVGASQSGTQATISGTCLGLELAARARPPRRSALAGLVLASDGYRSIPARAVDLWRPEGNDDGRPAGALLSDVYPPPIPEDRGALVVCAVPEIQGARTCIAIEELGRADVDHDGIEDLVVLVIAESGGGSMEVFGRTRVLSRRRGRGPLRIVALE
jgi:hypothetical protein